jgi:hypothetical protein
VSPFHGPFSLWSSPWEYVYVVVPVASTIVVTRFKASYWKLTSVVPVG